MISNNSEQPGLLSLWTPGDVQTRLCDHVRHLRRQRKWSREKLSSFCGVPAPTIKRFETSGEISLRQFLLIAGSLGMLDDLYQNLTKEKRPEPKRLEDLLH